jgi:hypothetical protein
MFRKSLCNLILMTAALLAANPLKALDENWLKKLTVQIQVQREGEEAPEFGSGVVLCSEDDLAYIVTAYHVLYKLQPGKTIASRSDVVKTTILFYEGVADPIVETRDVSRFELYPVPGKDLLLLTVDMRREIPHADPGQVPTLNDPVKAIGYAKETMRGEKEWVERPGKVLPPDASFLTHSAQLEEGFSGGPLFDEAGGLAGINIEFVSASDTGDSSKRTGHAVPLDQVKQAFLKKVPAGCWGNQEEAVKVQRAQEIYKRAIREVSLSNWCEAESLMREAITEQPLEGGTIHLQGMRYTTYLPVYHLGLALYKQGRWGEAYRAFRESAVQGEIREDKRYRKIKKYLAVAGEKRKTESPSATPACTQNAR